MEANAAEDDDMNLNIRRMLLVIIWILVSFERGRLGRQSVCL